MRIIYTCPKCGADLEATFSQANGSSLYYKCTKCNWTSLAEEDVVRIPYKQQTRRNPPSYVDYTDTINATPEVPMGCLYCSNHPINGGSGICHCTIPYTNRYHNTMTVKIIPNTATTTYYTTADN